MFVLGVSVVREVYMEGGSLSCVVLVCIMTSGGRKEGGGLYIYTVTRHKCS